jgi:hypothetical protein
MFVSSSFLSCFFRFLGYTEGDGCGFSATRQFPQAASLLLCDGSQGSRFLYKTQTVSYIIYTLRW